jgi:hypothetical protein
MAKRDRDQERLTRMMTTKATTRVANVSARAAPHDAAHLHVEPGGVVVRRVLKQDALGSPGIERFDHVKDLDHR